MIFLNNIMKFPGVARDVEDFERAHHGSPTKSCESLVAAMDGYINRDLRNRFMRQREHELKMSTSSRASALPSVENNASPSQQKRVRRRRNNGVKDHGSRSGSGSRSASRGSGGSSSRSFSRQSSADRSKSSGHKTKRQTPKRDKVAKPKAAPSETISNPNKPPPMSHSDTEHDAALPAEPKKSPCWYFTSCSCSHGVQCRFAHVKVSEAELRASKAKALGSAFGQAPSGKGGGKKFSSPRKGPPSR